MELAEANRMDAGGYAGILFIGDPHVCAWPPGFRKDDYADIVLGKLRWSLDYARQERLVPVLLGDLFHVPRDNPNWLLARLMGLLVGEILAIVGNHDLSEDEPSENDSLQVLLSAGRMRTLDKRPWRGCVGGAAVVIGGTNYGQLLPERINRDDLGTPRWVFWVTHHNLKFPGFEEVGHLDCREIPGVDLVVNGHLHRVLNDVVSGQTTWCNAGNIARVGRSEASLHHVPGVLRVDVQLDRWSQRRVVVPHVPFEDAFHRLTETGPAGSKQSEFVLGLQAMQAFKTIDGDGLRRFLESNLSPHANPRVKSEILNLLEEVMKDGGSKE